MIISITGGKGGVGKSTVSIGLAHVLSHEGKVLLVDADAGCPNIHIILNKERREVEGVDKFIPVFDESKCKECGKCSKACEFNAIVQVKNKKPFVVAEQCSGCRACQIVCPYNAIIDGSEEVGKIYSFKTKSFDCLTGETKIGLEEESIVVNALMEKINLVKNDYDFIIIDTSAGTHCPVISALNNSDYALIVTEPTPFGVHDMGLVLELCKCLGLENDVVVNKFNTGSLEPVKQNIKDYDSSIVSKIPYSNDLFKSYTGGCEFDKSLFKSLKDVIVSK